MKQRVIWVLVVLVAALTVGFATKPQQHRVVIQANIAGPEEWSGILHNVANLQKVFGAEHIQIEVVALGAGIDMVAKTNSAQQEDMRKLSETGVQFRACSNTMRFRHMQPGDLLPFVTPVDSGAAELVRQQEAGWAYLKGGQ